MSERKMIATIFWNPHGVLHTDFIPKRSSMNVYHCLEVLDELRDHVKNKARK